MIVNNLCHFVDNFLNVNCLYKKNSLIFAAAVVDGGVGVVVDGQRVGATAYLRHAQLCSHQQKP